MSKASKYFLTGTFLFITGATTLSAQASRTWVSGTGDDTNPCSRIAPCKSLAGALSKTAPGGEINAIDPGGFGSVTITKAITIDLTPFEGGVLIPGVNGIVVQAGANDAVILRGLDIYGPGTAGTAGIKFVSGKSLTVEKTKIAGVPTGIDVEATTNANIAVVNSSIETTLTNGVFVNNAAGIQTQLTLNNVEVLNNLGNGLAFEQGAIASVRNSVVSGSGADGILATSYATVDLDNVMSTENNVGVESAGGAVTRLTRSTVIDNVTGIKARTGMALSTGDNRVYGNGSGNGPLTNSLTLQ